MGTIAFAEQLLGTVRSGDLHRRPAGSFRIVTRGLDGMPEVSLAIGSIEGMWGCGGEADGESMIDGRRSLPFPLRHDSWSADRSNEAYPWVPLLFVSIVASERCRAESRLGGYAHDLEGVDFVVAVCLSPWLIPVSADVSWRSPC